MRIVDPRRQPSTTARLQQSVSKVIDGDRLCAAGIWDDFTTRSISVNQAGSARPVIESWPTSKSVYLVPFVEDEHTVFLKTIIPSRKATQEYLREESDDEEGR
jgi:hypothetical protein